MSTSILTANGLSNAAAAVAASTVTGVPLWVLAAMLEKESSGQNLYGGDQGGVYAPGDPERPSPNVVTEENYRRFEERVLAGATSNGVGPAQITHPSFIRDAQQRGIRLWVPAENILYGAELLARYLGGKTTDEAIRYAGTRYNGAAAYGEDLLYRAQQWRTTMEGLAMPLMHYPARSQIKTDAFWLQLERVEKQNGVTITCGPTNPYCVKGTHRHWDQSRHWEDRALDMSMDPRPGVPISNYEKTHLTAKALMLRARYGTSIGLILNRASDHKDHLHGDDGQSGYQINGVYDYDAIGDELIFGRNGKRVEDWQRILTAAGYPTSVDGNFGLQTYDNTRKAQYAWGLRPDAIVGPRTLSMGKSKEKPVQAPSQPAPSPEASRYAGFTTADIEAAQKALTAGGWTTAVDGSPGPDFQAEMKRAQQFLRAEGLYDDEVDLLPGKNFMAAITTWNKRLSAVQRVAGKNRYATARLIAALKDSVETPNTVYIAASGTDDAAVAPRPVLLANPGAKTLPSDTVRALREMKPGRVVILGGESQVTPSAAVDAYVAAGLVK